MAERYKTIGKIIASDAVEENGRIAGFVFRIELQDETQKVLPYACYLYSENRSKSYYGNKRMAELCFATGVTKLKDTDELLQIEFIVIHNGNTVKALRAIAKPEPKSKPSIRNLVNRIFS